MTASSFSPRVAVPVPLQDLFKAWQRARRGKTPSNGQLAFDARWLDNLLALQARLNAGDWQPTRTVSFIVDRPKTREIHAPAFADRIVHHWLIAQMEPLFEPVFIHDSFANRCGKGSHAAVDRLQAFMRSRNGHGYYLQLDVHNCFNSINRGVLYLQLCTRLATLERRHLLASDLALAMRSLCHKLLSRPAPEFQSQPERAKSVPPHKLLRNAKQGCGIPVGNLSSQFFVNVYLNALDQFVKHVLRVRHYVRYVDDLVLLGDSPQQLQGWHAQIQQFLAERLHLQLKNQGVMQALCQGVDFLGYRVYAAYRGVRPRVLMHCEQALSAWGRRHVRCRRSDAGEWLWLRASAADRQTLCAQVQSYWGHFLHAQSFRIRAKLWRRFPWLACLFQHAGNGEVRPSWVLDGVYGTQQYEALRCRYPAATVAFEKGFDWLFAAPGECTRPVARAAVTGQLRRFRQNLVPYAVAVQTGWLRHGLRRREVREWFVPVGFSLDRRSESGQCYRAV